MAPSYQVSVQAYKDIDEIWQYTAKRAGSNEVADRVVQRIYDEFAVIGDFPDLGHTREDIAPSSVRFRSVFSYTVAYRVDQGQVQIFSVLHGARNLEEEMKFRLQM